MPNDNKTTDAPNKVMVELPAGFESAEQVEKALASYNKTKEQTKLYDKAMRDAYAALRKAHPEQFEKLLRAEKVKVGLPVK